MFKPLLTWLNAPLMALFLTFAPLLAPVHATEDLRKVTVVSFGLFGDQGVFRSEASGAAEIVPNRFGGGRREIQYQKRRRCHCQSACSNPARGSKKDE